VAQVVECLSSKHETLSSNPNIAKNKYNKKEYPIKKKKERKKRKEGAGRVGSGRVPA
jgi:hypothetical protein